MWHDYVTCLWSLIFPNIEKRVELVVGVVLLEACVKDITIKLLDGVDSP